MPYVYSTLTSPQQYTDYVKHDLTGPKDDRLPVRKHSVYINGGANLAQGNAVTTPKGVMTQVSKEDLEFLKQIPAFNDHVKRGFITTSNKKINADKAAEDMEAKDGSAPKTPEDFPEDKQPTVGKTEEKK